MHQIDFSKYNSVEQLYEEKKKTYSIWFILFTIFFALIVVLQVATLIEYAVNKANYIGHYAQEIPEATTVQINNAYYSSVSTFAVLVCLTVGIFIWHVFSLAKATTKKDYSLYSFILSQIYLLVIIFQIITIIFSGLSYFKINSWDINKILRLTSTILFIVVYFAIFLQCSKIIKIFRYLKVDIMQRNIQTDPYFQMFSNFMNGNFGQFNAANNSEVQNQNPVTNDDAVEAAIVSEALPNKSSYRAKLELLDHEQLTKMAEKLNIFGAKDLTKDQLIEKISTIFEEKIVKNINKEDHKLDDKTKKEDLKNKNEEDENASDDDKGEN
ncbi:hypothetical protein [Metamycoplasma neophronis]|uniref:Rho termination factor N-terminal domain-containing protein n=1 Tax=Metamycoplasma neophronis TaxID=872983 RepID=A0ABY2Z1J5_9BACT|nr:hypothetical protein [Metamycoplasma neophronis]TPR53535.1 hypothetical protein FJR74_02450 [Metamycoplasma neophronis]